MKSPEKHPHYFTKEQIEQSLSDISKEKDKEVLFFCDAGDLLDVVNRSLMEPQRYTGDRTIKLRNGNNLYDNEHTEFRRQKILTNDKPYSLITEASYYYDNTYQKFLVTSCEREDFSAVRMVEGRWPYSKRVQTPKDNTTYTSYQLSTANNNPQYVAVVAQSSDIMKKKMDLAERNRIHNLLFVTEELKKNQTLTLKGTVVETHTIFPIKAPKRSILLYGYRLDPQNLEEDLSNIASHHQIKLTQPRAFGVSTNQTQTTDTKTLTDNNNEIEKKTTTSMSTEQSDSVKSIENSTSSNRLTDNNNEVEKKTTTSNSADQNDSVKPRENSSTTELSDSKTSKTVALISANQVHIPLDNLSGSNVEKTMALVLAQNNLSLENLTGSKVTKAMACVTANQNSTVNSNETSLSSDHTTQTAPAVSLTTSDNGFFSHKDTTLGTVIANATNGKTI